MKSYDANVREEALIPTQSFIVQAPAGSGKTALLMHRLLVLLTTAKYPEECLAITFTRKAAHEMRDRVLSALMNALETEFPPECPHAKKTWELAKQVLKKDKENHWNLLQNPNRLKIQTIDSLCASLTQSMPIMSELGSRIEIMENPESLYQSAVQSLFEGIETEEPWSESLRQVILHLNNNLEYAQKLLVNLLSHRDQWLPYLVRSSSVISLRAVLEKGLQAVICESLRKIKSELPSGFEELLELANFAFSRCSRNMTDWPGTTINDLEHWLQLTNWLLTEEGEFRKTVTHKQGFPSPSSTNNKEEKMIYQQKKLRMLELLNDLSNYPAWKNCLIELKQCPPPVYSNEEWIIVESLITILPVLSAHLNVIFKTVGKVDFTEISLAAIRALGDPDNPSDLALSLDYRIRHLLVDEFQDTSLSQFRLLTQLTAGWEPNDGRTLFLVGDPQQSIYRFRQAEVGLFISVKQSGIGNISLKPLTLSANFRSDPIIVSWVNETFSKSFPVHDDINYGAIQYSKSQAFKSFSEVSNFCEVNVQVLEKSQKKHKNIAENENIVENENNVENENIVENESITENENEIVDEMIIVEQEEAQHVIRIIEQTRQLEPFGSIALLVRSRTHLTHIMQAFRKNNILYQGIDLESLYDRPVIQDLMALTRALLHLGDRIAWLSILRFPWINISLSDLQVLSQAAFELPILYALNQYQSLNNLSIEAKEKISELLPCLKKALNQKGRHNLRSFITNTWVALKGHEFLYDHHSLNDAESFFEILEILEKKGGYEEPYVLEDAVKLLFSTPKESEINENAIQIMTIHKSKGLEFDTVILPGLGRKPRVEDNPLFLWEERRIQDANYLLFAPIKSSGSESLPIYDFIKRQKQYASQHEALRLFYVAATRARKRLYCLGQKPLPNSLLSLVTD